VLHYGRPTCHYAPEGYPTVHNSCANRRFLKKSKNCNVYCKWWLVPLPDGWGHASSEYVYGVYLKAFLECAMTTIRLFALIAHTRNVGARIKYAARLAQREFRTTFLSLDAVNCVGAVARNLLFSTEWRRLDRRVCWALRGTVTVCVRAGGRLATAGCEPESGTATKKTRSPPASSAVQSKFFARRNYFLKHNYCSAVHRPTIIFLRGYWTRSKLLVSWSWAARWWRCC